MEPLILACMWFKKKQPRKWEFGPKPEVNWKAIISSKYDLQVVCKIILTEILHLNDIVLNVYTNDKALKKFDNDDIQIQAILSRVGKTHMYSLHLRSKLDVDILNIICHEMVHLDQYERGDLDLIGNKFYWQGKEYTGDMSYWNRPWEKEAKKRSYEIEKQLKKLYYETDSR